MKAHEPVRELRIRIPAEILRQIEDFAARTNTRDAGEVVLNILREVFRSDVKELDERELALIEAHLKDLGYVE
jgi:hypothetical protein